MTSVIMLTGPSKLRVVKARPAVDLRNGWRLEVTKERDSRRVQYRAHEDGPGFDILKEKTSSLYDLCLKLPAPEGSRFALAYRIESEQEGLVEAIQLRVRRGDGAWSTRYADLNRPKFGARTGYVIDAVGEDEQLEFVITLSRRPGVLSVQQLSLEVLDEAAPVAKGAAASLGLVRVPEPTQHPLLHYVVGGAREFAHTHPLFDGKWYKAQLAEPLPAGMSPLEHYIRQGDAAGVSPHPLFDPTFYRSQLDPSERGGNALVHYLSTGVHRGIDPHPLFRSQWYSDPAARSSYEKAKRTVMASAVAGGSSKPAPVAAHPAGRVIVYTCLLGQYEALKPVQNKQAGVRYIAFTDDPTLKSDDWEIVPLRDRLSSARRTSRLPKILAHRYLPDHDVSLYLDASLTLVAPDVHAMVRECLGDADMALYPHHRRDCVYDEIDICETLGLEHAEDVSWYRAHYESLGRARGDGLFENTLIVRRNTRAAAEANELWWQTYRGERDQLALMSAIQRSAVKARAITNGRQVRNNPFVTFEKHHRTTLEPVPPRIFVFVAYAPAGYGQDLGRTYNDYMSMVGDDDVVVFIDHDAMFCSDHWYTLLQDLSRGLADRDCLIIGRTNRIGNPYQRIGPFQTSHDIGQHAAISEALHGAQGVWCTDVGPLNSSSGVVIALRKSTWKTTPFARGFLKVDNKLHIAFRDAKLPVYMPASLYAYHFYRADGDDAHAIRLPDAALPEVTDAGGGHVLRNLVYDDACGLDVAHYADLLEDGQSALFIRADAMMCDKAWYPKAEAILNGHGAGADPVVWTFSNNLTDGQSPRSDDILEHRAYFASADRPVGQDALESVSADDLVSFMADGRLLKAYVAAGGRTVAGLADYINARSVRCVRSAALYAYTQNRAALSQAPSPEAVQTALTQLRESRRVGILTLGFWPAQAGMEMMIHNLATHLTKAGDHVMLFAPKPTVDFVEIEHDYLLKRFKNEADLIASFETYHASLPFDVLLVQGGYEAAAMALRIKARTGVPVVLRTHGEDIQVDDETGYGYRRDPKKRAVIDHNIANVDRNVVIGEHIKPLVLDIAPQSDVRLIHNGVDTDRFTPTRSAFLRDRLGLAPDRKILLTVGRNVKKKTFHLAIQALAEVLKAEPNAVLVHVGKPGNGLDLEAEAARLGVSDAFFQTGALDYFDTPQAYASADVFVFPSKVETFGNVTLEALSSGLPCVEFDYEVNRAKIDQGVNGFVVPHGDITAMAEAIVRLLRDDDLRARFAVAARTAAEERFSWPQIARRYHQVFAEFRASDRTIDAARSSLGAQPDLDPALA